MELVNMYTYEGNLVLVSLPEWDKDGLPVYIVGDYMGGFEWMEYAVAMASTDNPNVFSIDSTGIKDGSIIRINRNYSHPHDAPYPPSSYEEPYTDSDWFQELVLDIRLKPIDGETGDDGAPGPPGLFGFPGPPGSSGRSIKGWDGDDGDRGIDGDVYYGWR